MHLRNRFLGRCFGGRFRFFGLHWLAPALFARIEIMLAVAGIAGFLFFLVIPNRARATLEDSSGGRLGRGIICWRLLRDRLRLVRVVRQAVSRNVHWHRYESGPVVVP